jgi:branched-chain amino acid transport system permease protein
LGIAVVFQNLISVAWGDETRILYGAQATDVTEILGARVSMVQCLIMAAGALSTVATVVLLKATRLGTLMNALARDANLAHSCGIEVERCVVVVFMLGSALAGLAGIMSALDVNMTPNMGMPALLLGVVAVIVGGVDSIAGVVFGALLLAIARELGVWVIGSQWQDAIAFAVLIVFLLLRPQGFLGKRLEKASV